VTGKAALPRHTPVSVCQQLLEIEPLLVGIDDDLLSVMRRSAAQPETRLIGVVDASGVLVGVLPTLRIVESVIARVVPESLLGDIADTADVAKFGHALDARTAGEAMIEPATIRPADTIGEAFRRMHLRHLSGLYVIDETGRPTGYLDVLELAIRYVDELEGQPPPANP
jgi:CBS domain-containing protein